VPFLEDAARIVRTHHERFDGSGYPEGLAGEEIPLAARIFALADTLDAITTDRPYRPAASMAEARATIAAGAGTQFDPAVVAAYEELPDEELERIRAEIR
jgi:ribonuclease P protein subunit RPR2